MRDWTGPISGRACWGFLSVVALVLSVKAIIQDHNESPRAPGRRIGDGPQGRRGGVTGSATMAQTGSIHSVADNGARVINSTGNLQLNVNQSSVDP
jgi:hypothetical protein